MCYFATRVRLAASLLALLSPVAASDAQVGIAVKRGTAWTSSIELTSLQPLEFRWKWDGFETPTRVAWQLATQTPGATAATRSSDVIASETALRLPAKSGIYELFTVNPLADWPSKFYVRVRVDAGRKTAYSAWVTVSVLQRTSLVAYPTCALSGWKKNVPDNSWDVGAVVKPLEPISPGETVGFGWNFAFVHIIVKNDASTEARYRRNIFVLKNGVSQKELLNTGWYVNTLELDPTTIRSIGGRKADTLTLGEYWISGHPAFYDVNGGSTDAFETIVYVIPLEGPAKKCSLRFSVK
jgi:hypothetical protein